jgi:hypothetical protein
MAAALPYILAATTAMQVGASYRQAEYQSAAYKLQAQQAELQGRQGALNYNKQANNILERQQQIQAMARARAAAGGVNPDTGSALTMQEITAYRAGKEINIAQENAEMALYGGLAASQNLMQAADYTSSMAEINALIQTGTGAARVTAVATDKQLPAGG